LLVSVPDAFSVKVDALVLAPLVLDPLEDELAFAAAVMVLTTAPAATVKSPCTATVTLALTSAADKAVAVLASIVSPSGSRSQLPFRPMGAEALTKIDGDIVSLPCELVSMLPPLPPSFPPVALNVPATVVCWLDQTLI